MIFAELDYPAGHSEVHSELVMFLSSHFAKVKSGLQGDSWISIRDSDVAVEVDTFTSLRHQVKSNMAGAHVQQVIATLQTSYSLRVFDPPQLEAHEDE